MKIVHIPSIAEAYSVLDNMLLFGGGGEFSEAKRILQDVYSV